MTEVSAPCLPSLCPLLSSQSSALIQGHLHWQLTLAMKASGNDGYWLILALIAIGSDLFTTYMGSDLQVY